MTSLEAMAHDFGHSDPQWPIDFALREALAADLAPLSSGVLRKGDWQHASYGLASLLYAGGMICEYSPRHEAMTNNAHCVPPVFVAILSVVHGEGAGLEKALCELVGLGTRAVVSLLMRGGDGGPGGRLYDDKSRRPGMVLLLERLVREAERVAPQARQLSLPYCLTRAERLDPITRASAAKFALFDDDEEGGQVPAGAVA